MNWKALRATMIGKIAHTTKTRGPSRAGSRNDTNEINENDPARNATWPENRTYLVHLNFIVAASAKQ